MYSTRSRHRHRCVSCRIRRHLCGADRIASDTGDAWYSFEVEEWIKGDLGARIDVRAPAQGSACGFELAESARTGVFIRMDGSTARSGLCDTVSAAAMLAASEPLRFTGDGPARFVLAAPAGPFGLLMLDSSGLPVGATAPDREVWDAVLCPGGDRVATLSTRTVDIWDLATSEAVQTIDVWDLQQSAGVRLLECSSDGASVRLFVDEWSGTPSGRVVDARAPDDILMEGSYVDVDAATGGWVASLNPTDPGIVFVTESGEVRPLLETGPTPTGTSVPSLDYAVSSDGNRVLVSKATFDDERSTTSYLVYELPAGRLAGEIADLPIGDIMGWIGDDAAAINFYPVTANAPTFHRLDLDGMTVTPLEVEAMSYPPVVVDGVSYDVLGSSLYGRPLEGGQADELASLRSDSFRVVAVLTDGPIVTAVAPSTTETRASVPPAFGVAVAAPQAASWPPLVIPGALIGVLAVGAVLWRRRAS